MHEAERGEDVAVLFTGLLAETVGPSSCDPPVVVDEFVAEYLCGLLGPDAEDAQCLDEDEHGDRGDEREDMAEVRGELVSAVAGLIPCLLEGDVDGGAGALAFARRVRAHLVQSAADDSDRNGRESVRRAGDSLAGIYAVNEVDALVELFPSLGPSDAARYLRNAQNQSAISRSPSSTLSAVEAATTAVLADLDSGALRFEPRPDAGDGNGALCDDVKMKIKARYEYEEVKSFRPCNAVPNMGASGGATAASKARYRDGVIVSNSGAKYIFESAKPEWDGGSKGKVITKGKRGKGYVG